MGFADEVAERSQGRLAAIIDAGRGGEGAADAKALLQVALVNEISVSELAAAWVGATEEVDVKVAFARQSGDEAGHFQLVAERVRALGFDVDAFVPPPANPLYPGQEEDGGSAHAGGRCARSSELTPPDRPDHTRVYAFHFPFPDVGRVADIDVTLTSQAEQVRARHGACDNVEIMGSDQAPTATGLSLDSALAYQTIIRDMVQHENELINQRLGWLFTLQGLLFGAIGLAWKSAAEIVIAVGVVGILSCISVGYSLAVSVRTTGELIELAQTYKRPHPTAIFPPTIGARTPTISWLSPARVLPWVLGAAWLAVVVLKVRSLVQGDA